MTADALWPLQQAVYTALRADATLKTLTGTTPARVYDHVPSDVWPADGETTNAAAFKPYVVVGDDTAGPFDTMTEDGAESILTIHTWSRYRGRKETKQIMSAVTDALDDVSLSVTGHTLVLLLFEFSSTFLDPDGLTRHGVQRFRALTQVT